MNVVEIWDKDLYEQTLEEDIDFADLAEEVMGNIETDEQ